jgi:hypothetical protein
MLRVRRIVTLTAVALAAGVLAGCSGGSLSMPSWMSFGSSSPPPPQTLQFESDPPGADVRTAQGLTCQTPCSLSVPPESQSVSFTRMGYLPQTVAVTISVPEHSMFESAGPVVQPNPVAVVLQPAGPPPKLKKLPPKHPRPHKPAPAPANGAPPPPPNQGSPFPPPPPPQR